MESKSLVKNDVLQDNFSENITIKTKCRLCKNIFICSSGKMKRKYCEACKPRHRYIF